MSATSADSLSPGHGDDSDDFSLEDALYDLTTKRRKSRLFILLKRRKQIGFNRCDLFFWDLMLVGGWWRTQCTSLCAWPGRAAPRPSLVLLQRGSKRRFRLLLCFT